MCFATFQIALFLIFVHIVSYLQLLPLASTFVLVYIIQTHTNETLNWDTIVYKIPQLFSQRQRVAFFEDIYYLMMI